MISLYPNSTHILQPADVAVFKPLKSGWKSSVRTWKFENFPKEVTRYTFGSIIEEVFNRYATSTTIKNGFRKCGLFPFDKNNVDYTKCIPNRRVDNISSQLNTQQTSQMNVIDAIEQKIENETFKQFLEADKNGQEWMGDIKSTDLYKVWFALKSSCTITSENRTPSNINQEIITPQVDMVETPTTSRIHENVNLDNGLSISCPSTSSKWKTPDGSSKILYESKEDKGFNVPSPFKKCLVFPTARETVTPKRKRTIFPAVVSSAKYREYYENENKKKLIPKKKMKEPSPVNESSSV